jgi:hypothetical protein
VPNENFRRELGHVFDEMAGTPSAALPDRVRSSLTQAPERRGPFWIAGLAAALIAVIVVSLLVVANLNRHPNSLPAPAARPTPTSSLPAFVCNSSTGLVTQGSPPVAFVDQVLTGTQIGYDSITIEFNNDIPGQVDVTPQDSAAFTQGASGQAITLAGNAGLLLTMHGADEHTSYSGPTDFKTGFVTLVEARQVQDFEGTVQWGLGVSKASCYRAYLLANPARLVIDVQTG